MEEKECEVCGDGYIPAPYQEKSQKYCSKVCKRKKQDEVRKERGIASGGYNRTVYIKVWMKSLGMLYRLGECFYCKCNIQVDDKWTIDHTIPRSVIRERRKIKNDTSNMQVVCQSCNNRKGALDSKSFRKILKETNGLEENKVIG